MIEIEVQNETHQTQFRIKAMSVPRIGEGIRLKEPDSTWASYDVLDVWYQQADYGEVWVPYLHVKTTPADGMAAPAPAPNVGEVPDQAMPIADFLAKFEGDHEHETVKLNLDMSEEQ
ncbi:hypothetical protein K3152_08950 [Qipengyuania sp. 1NDH17]|uniref:Uncharacterized protein n=1 Tax=Qipengyuania polymorpha TaxID=2867234 RepID=A0ABS7IXS7_9SPHN|nr:hypothetical protein [Qipengyuania polymorpha]